MIDLIHCCRCKDALEYVFNIKFNEFPAKKPDSRKFYISYENKNVTNWCPQTVSTADVIHLPRTTDFLNHYDNCETKPLTLIMH